MNKKLKILSVALSLLCAPEASYASSSADSAKMWDEVRRLSSLAVIPDELEKLRAVIPSGVRHVAFEVTSSVFASEPIADEEASTQAVCILKEEFLASIRQDFTILSRVDALDDQIQTAETAEMRMIVSSLLGNMDAAARFAGVASVRAAEENVLDKKNNQRVVEALLKKFSRDEVAEYIREMYLFLPAAYLVLKWPDVVPAE